MVREFPFPFFGHGATDSARLWIVFREPIGAAWKVLDAGAPDAISLGEPVDRVVEIDTEGPTTTKQAKEVDAWLASAHAAQPIAFAAFADETDGDAWHDWSRKRIGKDILPWLVETWRSAPAFASTLASRAQAQVLGQYNTKKPEAIAQIVDALQAALGLDAGADSQLARQVGWLIHRLPEPGPIVASLPPRLRVLVWAGNEIAPASLDAVLAALAELGDAAKPLGHDVNRIAARWGWTALHERALELDGAPVGSFLAIAKAKPDALDELIRRHFDRFVADNLDFLLQNGVMHELDGLVDRCIVAAAERADVEAAGFVANALYKQTGANRAHVSVRMARDYVARFRALRRDRLIATVYTNILLAYGAAASSDETVRVVTEEIEEILRDDPDYFGATADKSADIAAGKAGHDILASAYGSAACGRAVLGDGEASARWLREAREHRWQDLALCSNLVCFQNMRDDPYLKPLVAEIADAEVSRLEAGLKGKKSKDTNALFTVALTLHNGGHLDAAERYYRKVLAQSPKHPDALNNLGNIHGTRGDYAAALESYDAALAVVPEHPLFHACRAWALARAERYTEAVEASTRSIELDPNQASGYFPRGAAWLGLGDRGKAAEDFRCGVALNPGWRASEKDDPWFGDLVAIIEAG